ncbi:hypothetical protein ACUOFC_68635, partial [Escherichia sp. TWPC-MK]
MNQFVFLPLVSQLPDYTIQAYFVTHIVPALVFAYAYSMNKDKRTKIYSAYPNEIKFLESL